MEAYYDMPISLVFFFFEKAKLRAKIKINNI